jgi:hypothetical protein
LTTKQRIPLPGGSTPGADIAVPVDDATNRPGIVVITDVYGPSPAPDRTGQGRVPAARGLRAIDFLDRQVSRR